MDLQDVLIVSSHLENRKKLLRSLDGLPVTAFCLSSTFTAKEVLALHQLAIIFCEQWVSDGSYRQLLSHVVAGRRTNRLIVILNKGDWDETPEALRLGASEVLKCPLQAPDVDIALIRALRTRREAGVLNPGAPVRIGNVAASADQPVY